MRYFKIVRTGLLDGWTQPGDFGVGMTYEDGSRAGDRRQFIYDHASLLGQRAARRVLRSINSEGTRN